MQPRNTNGANPKVHAVEETVNTIGADRMAPFLYPIYSEYQMAGGKPATFGKFIFT
jgi:hypothetical protein